MLGRKLTGGASFVCLRCRLQRAGAPKRLPFAAVALSSLRAAPQRYFGSDSGRYDADETNRQTDRETDDPFSRLESNFEHDRDTFDRNEGAAPYRQPPPSRPAPKRTYKSRGHVVSPEQEGLSIDMLGKPGSAIVLREKRAFEHRPRFPQFQDADSAAANIDFANILQGSAVTEAEDILLNIHELKPNDTQILTDREFNELKDTLTSGFTVAQLARYVKEYEDIRRLTGSDEHIPETPAWVVERQPWAPTVATTAGDLEPHLQGYITRGMTPKKRLAVRLMRECWDVSNQAVLDKDGYLSIRLRNVEFELLTLGNRRWLEGTARAILARVKEVKLIRESQLLSITAPKHTAESILDRVYGLLSNTRTSEFAVDLVSPKPLEPSVLEELGRMTNTVTRLDPSGKKVVVTWIHAPDRDENFETAGETIMRFLRDAYGPKTRVSAALGVVPSDLAHHGRYLPVLNCTPKLPWQERFDKWERWTAAIPQWNDRKTRETLIPADILPFDVSTKEAVEDPERSVGSSKDWSSELQTETRAVFGHAVFARQNQPPSSPVPPSESTSQADTSSTSQLDTSLSRTFVPSLPALGNLNLPTNLLEKGLWHTTVVLRFTPSPDTTTSAPDLELRLDADHREIKSLSSLRAISDTFTGDVLFPAAAVDARVVQQRYFDLPGESIEEHAPAVIAFLAKSDLRPWAGKLTTPHVLPGVHLPRRIVSPPSSATTPTPTENTTTDNDPIPINYTLAHHEIQRTVTGEYESLKLRYTSTQAGQRGGERAELSLDAVRVNPEPLDPTSPNNTATSSSSSPASPQDWESGPAYEIIDESELRTQLGGDNNNSGGSGSFVSHNRNNPDKLAAAVGTTVPAKPVGLEEFVQVASGIVHERGRLKWHAKRS